MIDDCAKLQFVPVMEKVQTRLVFGGGLRLLQTSIRPALLGLVSSREVDSLMKEPEMRESGWVVSTGVGLQSPLLVEKIENGGSSVLKTLVSAPPSKGKVRAIDHTSTLGCALRSSFKTATSNIKHFCTPRSERMSLCNSCEPRMILLLKVQSLKFKA